MTETPTTHHQTEEEKTTFRENGVHYQKHLEGDQYFHQQEPFRGIFKSAPYSDLTFINGYNMTMQEHRKQEQASAMTGGEGDSRIDGENHLAKENGQISEETLRIGHARLLYAAALVMMGQISKGEDIANTVLLKEHSAIHLVHELAQKLEEYPDMHLYLRENLVLPGSSSRYSKLTGKPTYYEEGIPSYAWHAHTLQRARAKRQEFDGRHMDDAELSKDLRQLQGSHTVPYSLNGMIIIPK